MADIHEVDSTATARTMMDQLLHAYGIQGVTSLFLISMERLHNRAWEDGRGTIRRAAKRTRDDYIAQFNEPVSTTTERAT